MCENLYLNKILFEILDGQLFGGDGSGDGVLTRGSDCSGRQRWIR